MGEVSSQCGLCVTVYIWILAPPFVSRVPLRKLSNLSVPQFLHM